jgi:hypothetical protein
MRTSGRKGSGVAAAIACRPAADGFSGLNPLESFSSYEKHPGFIFASNFIQLNRTLRFNLAEYCSGNGRPKPARLTL